MEDIVWQGPLIMVDGKNVRKTTKLKDATLEELKKFDIHCSKMLDGDGSIIGKKKKLELTEQILEKLKCELTVRGLCKNSNKLELSEKLNKFDLESKSYNITIGEVITNDVLYKNVSLKMCIDACLCSMGNFPSNCLPFEYILNIGVQKDPEFEDIQDVLEYLGLPSKYKLEYKHNGINIFTLRNILESRGKKISDISTSTLTEITSRILPQYIYKLQRQIKKWNDLKSAILEEIYKR